METIDQHIANYLGDEEVARLSAATREGHTFIEIDKKMEAKGVIQEGNKLYFDKTYHLEKLIEERVGEMQVPLPPITERVAELTEEQNRVIQEASKTQLGLISGGPGTGKTYTAGWLIRQLAKENTSIALAAPTGKAAHRLKQSIERVAIHPNIEASTLHALLKYGSPQADLNHLPHDIILVDESSMLDLNLLALLLKKVKSNARLILMGDPDQLPPIGGGRPFTDLVKKSKNVSLTECIRIDNPEILELAHAVNQGKGLSAEEKGVRQLIQWVTERKPSFENFRLLCPIKKGFSGADAINRALFEVFGLQEVPIIITKNDYEKGLFNGECGTIKLTKEQFDLVLRKKANLRTLKGLRAEFDGLGSFSVSLLPPFDLAYCLSVHKSQGSEYQQVVLFLPEPVESYPKEMLYTAITRAKTVFSAFVKPH